MIVMKFGGTSVRDAEAIRRVTAIVLGTRETRRLVVVSALAGVTNELLALASTAARGDVQESDRVRQQLLDRHLRISGALIAPPISAEIEKGLFELVADLERLSEGVALIGEASPRTIDAFAATGELLSSLLVSGAIRSAGRPCAHVDARTFIITDGTHTLARPETDRCRAGIEKSLLPEFRENEVVVTQGFIGSTPQGVTTTLGRGGSDFSASFVGALVGASQIQIWTDVDGILTADPSIVPKARNIGSMSFREAAELSYFGARVLHPDTILPAVQAGIPVAVRNSLRPDSPGTLITETSTAGEAVVKSIAYKEGITLLTIVSARMFLAHGFLARVFEVFDRYKTVVHAVATSEVTITAAIDDMTHLSEIAGKLRDFSSVTVAGGKAIVCVVGEGLAGQTGIAARLLASAGDVEVHMISQGASEVNIGFVIDEGEIAGVVKRLHRTFFERSAEKEAA